MSDKDPVSYIIRDSATLPGDITFVGTGGVTVRIKPDGDIYWHERLITTDDDFRAMMRELHQYFRELLGGR